MKVISKKSAFTLLELMVTLSIMAILISAVLVTSSSIRRTNRDTKRVSDVNSIHAALENYYKVLHVYPATLTAGAPLASTSPSVIFLSEIPANPQPTDGNCPLAAAYNYVRSVDGSDYVLSFCLGSRVGDWGAGLNTISSETESTCIPDCVFSCGAGADGCGGTCSKTITCEVGSTCANDHCIKD